MSTDLKRIGKKACKEPKLVFTSLYHHVTDVDNLIACYDAFVEHGKTMTAMTGIKLMPKLNQNELWEVNKIYSAKGNLAGNELFLTRPFQQAHNNTLPAALSGSGVIPQPDLVSLVHEGILFFDEINLADKFLIELLREPINNEKYSVIKQRGTIECPCNFIFVAAMKSLRCQIRD